MIDYTRVRCVESHMAFLNSGKYDNSRKRYKTETDLQWKTNRKL